MTRIAIVGLGLIGGSIALGIKQAMAGARIVAVDTATVVGCPEARALGIELHEIGDLTRALAGAELAVLAAPVAAIGALVVEALEHAEVVTDCGSTKRVIAAASAASPRRGRFVPGHPMAGGPSAGVAQARAELFRGRRWLLCPERSDADALARVEHLVRALGAEPAHLTASEHDHAVALTSHVPQLLASALRARAAARNVGAAAGPAFEGATRAASDNDPMWRDVFATNADAIASALAELGADLDLVRAALQRDPPDIAPALALLARGRAR
jgi:prephenate dehydrogenase